jgi:hypothetical protein
MTFDDFLGVYSKERKTHPVILRTLAAPRMSQFCHYISTHTEATLGVRACYIEISRVTTCETSPLRRQFLSFISGARLAQVVAQFLQKSLEKDEGYGMLDAGGGGQELIVDARVKGQRAIEKITSGRLRKAQPSSDAAKV